MGPSAFPVCGAACSLEFGRHRSAVAGLLGSVVLGEVYAATCNECMINSASGDFVCIFCRCLTIWCGAVVSGMPGRVHCGCAAPVLLRCHLRVGMSRWLRC